MIKYYSIKYSDRKDSIKVIEHRSKSR